jgi:hypothetical protein
LSQVVFESGVSLQAMIESGGVDLKGSFRIYVCEGGEAMNFPGYSICMIPGVRNLIELVKATIVEKEESDK